MKKYGTLTIGVICRNGQPFIEQCLHSVSSGVSPLSEYFDSISCILVDSNSSDNTLGVMLAFSIENQLIQTDVFLIEGDCNAAIARNIILRNCNGDFVFLCDGDIVIHYEFIVSAVEKIIDNQADAIVGQLSEKWFDSENKIYKEIAVRKKIYHDQFVRMAGGIIVISRKVVQSEVTFDEKFKRNQDRDYSLRISDSFKILAIPDFVGIHLTQPYYSTERFGTFLKQHYNKYLGMLIRKHLYSLQHVFVIIKHEKGVILGILYMILLICSIVLCIFQICIPLLLLLLVVCVDMLRQLREYPLKRFVMNRFMSPIMVVQGFFFKERITPHYTIKKVDEKP
jgi:glycosyltransferase involved in cell wall biosynthesis